MKTDILHMGIKFVSSMDPYLAETTSGTQDIISEIQKKSLQRKKNLLMGNLHKYST